MLRRLIYFNILAFFFVAQVFAGDVTLIWDASPGAASYRVYQSIDSGVTWVEIDETTATEMTISGVPEDGLVLFKVSAMKGAHEAARDWSGAWYWKPPNSPGSAGIQ
jgi:hypothetical protein